MIDFMGGIFVVVDFGRQARPTGGGGGARWSSPEGTGLASNPQWRSLATRSGGP